MHFIKTDMIAFFSKKELLEQYYTYKITRKNVNTVKVEALLYFTP